MALVGTDLGMEVVALVVIEAEPLGVNAVETVHVLLTRVVLVVSRVRGVDPDVVGRVLETELTRRDVGDPVTAVNRPVETVAELLVDEVSEDSVTRAGETEQVDVVHTLLDTVLEVNGGNKAHRSAKRVAHDSETVLIVLRHVLLDLGEHLVDDLDVGVLEAESDLRISRRTSTVALVEVDSREVDIVESRDKRFGVGALERDGDTELVGVVDQGTLDEEAITRVPQQLGTTDVHTIMGVLAVGLLGKAGRQGHERHVAVDVIRLSTRALRVREKVRNNGGNHQSRQDSKEKSTEGEHDKERVSPSLRF